MQDIESSSGRGFAAVQTLYYYTSRGGSFETEVGPFMRVQNAAHLLKFSQESAANNTWTFSNQGPFKVLGKEKIDEITKNTTSNLDKITKLNEAIFCYCRDWYEKIRAEMKKPASSPVQSFPLNPTTLFDSQKKTLLQHCFLKILENKADFSAIDRLIELGVDLNSSVNFNLDLRNFDAPPIFYLWSMREKANLEKIKLLINYLIEKGANINQTFGPCLDNMMGFQIKSDRSSSFFSLFQQYKGDINHQNTDRNSLLHMALYGPGWIPISQIEVATILVKAGIDVTLTNKNGDHAIHLLCHYGNNGGDAQNSLLKAILDIAPKEVNTRDGQNRNPLEWSIRTGKIDFVEIIKLHPVEIQEDPDDAKKYLNVFIEFVAEQCRLYDWSTDVRSFTEEFIRKSITGTCLPLLNSILPFVGKTKEGLRDILIAYDKNKSTLLHSLAGSCPWILSYLQEQQYIKAEDLKLQDAQGVTVEQLGEKTICSFKLMISCYSLDKKTAFEMLQKDIFLDLQIQDGITFLHATLYSSLLTSNQYKNPDGWKTGFKIFSKLLEKKADPNLLNNTKTTPLLDAISYTTENGNGFMLELLNYGADPGIKDNTGVSAREAIRNYSNWTIINKAILGAPYIN